MATLYVYKLVREDWNHPPGKRTKTITRDKPDLRVGGLYVHLGRGYPGCQRVLSMEIKEREEEKQRMLKDVVIAILAGISIAQQITPPGHPARAAVILIMAGTVFMVLLELYDLWDKRFQIIQRLCSIICAISTGLFLIMRRASSWFRWYLTQLYTWPVEMVQRHRRRQVLIEYIERLRAMGEVKGDDVQCM